MQGFMLDTNIFNRIVNEQIPLALFAGRAVFATHVQRDELNATLQDEKRRQLLAAFKEVNPGMIPTSTAVWDDSSWGETRWSAEDGVYERMLTRLRELDQRKRYGFNQSRDVRIAETAIKAEMTVVTDDKNLSTVTQEFGGRAIRLDQLRDEPSGR